MVVVILILKIKEYRLKSRMTQKELAHKAGLTQSYIAALEKNDRTKSPTLNTIEKIAIALEICWLQLIGCDFVIPCSNGCSCDSCEKKFW
jgi:transcriptional regulator with XRE-family HTH domain